jgi:hypothetical protein
MLKSTIGIAFSAAVLAGAFGFATTGAARAESVMKICGEQWKAAKAAGTTGGKTWPEFLAQCRTEQKAAAPGEAPAAQPAAAPAAAPAAPAPAATAVQEPPPDAAAAPTKSKRKSTKTSAMAPGPGQFGTEAEAKAKCPTDSIVWVNTASKIFHYSNNSEYGKTKKGAYMCEADATAGGARAAKNEKKP